MTSHKTYVLCEKPQPTRVYHDFNQPISNVESKHVSLLEKEIANTNLPADLKSKVVNMKIQDLLALNKDLKYGKRQRSPPPPPPPPSAPQQKKELPRKRKRINETGSSVKTTGEDYVSSKLRDYATSTQFGKAKEIIKYFQDNPDYDVNLETGELSIRGQKQKDSAIDVALALTASPTTKRPHMRLKSFTGLSQKLSETDFPLFLITHKPTRDKYAKLYGGLVNWD